MERTWIDLRFSENAMDKTSGLVLDWCREVARTEKSDDDIAKGSTCFIKCQLENIFRNVVLFK